MATAAEGTAIPATEAALAAAAEDIDWCPSTSEIFEDVVGDGARRGVLDETSGELLSGFSLGMFLQSHANPSFSNLAIRSGVMLVGSFCL